MPPILQGLAAHDGDVLFVGAKLGQVAGPTAPPTAATAFEPRSASADSCEVQNLTAP
ncbi:MAG TPA: hypothetical protein VHW23_29130 [Kofleriaceae bacterium]|nr:hypothetical protein [Kofleriaceae bacterium]